MKKEAYEIKYPKLVLLLLTILIACFLFKARTFAPFHNFLLSLGYFGTFIAGMLFSYGFTASPATAILLILAKEQNILFSGVIGGAGALISDLIIFKFIRLTFDDELNMLSNGRFSEYFSGNSRGLFKKYFVQVLAGFIIASPLPDEIGVSLLAASRVISTKTFSVIAYSLNTAGIFIVLIIGKMI